MISKEKAIKMADYALPAMVLVLSMLSATDFCSGGCSALSDFQLFGQHFAFAGAIYAIVLAVTVVIAGRLRKVNWVVDFLVFAGAGAEIYFIAIQKFIVKKWCPVCLTIAVVIFIFALLRGAWMYRGRDPRSYEGISHGKWFIIHAWKTALVILFVVTGLLTSLISVGRKHVQLFGQTPGLEHEAQAQTMKKLESSLSAENIWFGEKSSPVEVYFVFDWYCEFCREIEPVVESVLPSLGKTVRYTWIDMAIHPESMQLIPFGQAILLQDKAHYMKARHVLLNVAKSEKTISPGTIKDSFKKAGLRMPVIDKGKQSVLFIDGIMFCRANNVNMTPSVIIVDTMSGQRKVLSGANQITRDNLLQAVKGVARNG